MRDRESPFWGVSRTLSERPLPASQLTYYHALLGRGYVTLFQLLVRSISLFLYSERFCRDVYIVPIAHRNMNTELQGVFKHPINTRKFE